MLRVTCQICDTHLADVSRDEVERRIASGRYATTQWFKGKAYAGIFGMCSDCATLSANEPSERVQADAKGGARAADAQMIRIREYVAEARRMMPAISLENAVRVALEFEFDPHHEGDRGFRAYLLGEGAPKDAAIDAQAREFMSRVASVVEPEDEPEDND